MIKNKFAYPHYLVSFAFCWSFCFFLLNNAPIFSDYDFFWHIQAGVEIFKSKSLILSNHWSFSAPNHYWYNISWLWDVLLHLLSDIFGVSIIYYFICFTYALIIALTSYYLLLQKNLNYISIIFTILFISIILWNFAVARPHTITFLFTVLYAILLKLYSQTNRKLYLYWLPIIMVLWVNTHGGFIIGGLLIVSALLNEYSNSKKINFSLLICGFTCFFCLFLNPYSYKIISAILSTTHSAFTKTIDEWQPFTLGRGFFVFSIYTILFIISMDVKNTKISFFDKFNSVFWLIMSLLAVRNIPVFVLLSSLFFASNIQDLNILRKWGFKYSPSKKLIFIYSVVFCFCASLSLHVYKWKDTEKPIIDPQPSINFITNKYPKFNFLNSYSLGGAIIYFSNGKQKVFVDGRAGTAYPETVLNQYSNAVKNACLENFSLIDKYKIQGVITHKGRALDKILGKKYHWTEVYSDKNFIVYVK